MMWAIVLLVLAVILFGLGFAVKVLWWAAVIALVLALVGFFLGRGRSSV
jgi:predicted membrane protein